MGCITRGAKEFNNNQHAQNQKQEEQRRLDAAKQLSDKIRLEQKFNERVGKPAPDFISYYGNGANTFQIPKNAWGPFPTRGPGMQFIGGQGGNGLSDKVTSVRFMEPTRNHEARVSYFAGTQTRHPTEGITVSRSHPAAHLKTHGKNDI